MKEYKAQDGAILIGILAVGSILITGFCQYLFETIKNKKTKTGDRKKKIDDSTIDLQDAPPLRMNRRSTIVSQKIGKWGQFRLYQDFTDPVTIELSRMATLINEVERVNNIIVDLQLETVQMHENPIVAYKTKMTKNDPFLDPKALVEPLSFVLHTPELRSAQMISFTKKWLKAGPRSHIYFKPSEVRAAIVSMGGMVPGVNVVIKQLVHTLQEFYGIKQIFGIKHSFESSKKSMLVLNCEKLKTIHHFGGSYLGVHRSDLTSEEIADRLSENNINQLYIIGGPGTLKLANQLRDTIKMKKLNIAFCVIPKQITNSIPITQRSIGFQTALQESQKMVEAGYTQSHAHNNGVAIIKVPGKTSGFLAVEVSLASRNIQTCLVPQFPFELYGEKGLLAFIHQKLIQRSNCTIVVAEGCNESIVDYQPPIVSHDWDGTPIKEDINKIIKSQLMRYLAQRKVVTSVKTIDTYQIRASAANAKQTSICCKFSTQSVHCVMAGYTNFMIGSITNKSIMIPIDELTSGYYSDCLMQHSNYWSRLLLMTCQPSFRNN